MRNVYWPGSSFAVGKLKLPCASLTTEIVIVEPAFLALTTTPSMAPSAVEAIWPASLPAACARSKADDARPTANAAAVASNNRRIVMWGFSLCIQGVIHPVGVALSVGPPRHWRKRDFAIGPR